MGTVDFPLRVVELNLLVIIFQNSWIDMMIYPNNVVPLHHPKTTDMPRQVRGAGVRQLSRLTGVSFGIIQKL